MTASPRKPVSHKVARRARIAFLLLVVSPVAFVGCSTPGSYIRIPAHYTTLPTGPNAESYLIELVRPVGDPTATRYNFSIEPGGSVTAHISTISKNGARSERRRSGEAASRLLQIFRNFDWASIEAPPPDDDANAPPPDVREVVFKARTQRSYREAQVRLAECAALRKLLAALEAATRDDR